MADAPVAALLHLQRSAPDELAPTPLPDEWVLRELPRLDLDDPASFVALTERYGPVVPLRPDPFALLPKEAFGKAGIVDAQRDVQRWATEQWRAAGVSDAHGNTSYGPDQLLAAARFSQAVSLTVVRHHFDLLRALVRHVIAHQQHRKLATAWEAVTLNAPPESAEEAWVMFECVLNAALRPFSAHITTAANPAGRQAPPLYAIAALQIFNVFVEDLSVHTCKKCGDWFVRRSGGADHGQYRTRGRMFYCSKSCAKAAAQRAYYRRKQKENNDGLDP